ncbi:MAG TPA: mechanosensitive ion channel domain-containing protein [Candidatus Sulfotelmatobacter sp.]|jgi:small-conductance mechanosensitive channel|nr:mechanosensitive ion channel domain-containing protein [Candidatus Sulfotelmatobacter sp.]
MTKSQKILGAVVVLLLAISIYGFWISREPETVRVEQSAKKSNSALVTLVDMSPLKISQQVAKLAGTPEERALAQDALHRADEEVDLTFDSALREALLHPPPLSAEVKEIQDRLQKSQKLLNADQEQAKLLAEQLAKAPASKQDALQVQLAQAEADMDLDQNEVDDAKEDLARAGGSLADRIQALKKDHEDAAHISDTAIPTGGPPVEQWGLVHRVQQLLALHWEKWQLADAKAKSDVAAAALAAQHNALDAKVEEEKGKSPGLAHHSKKRTDATPVASTQAGEKSQEDSAALLKKTEEIAGEQKTLASLDKRVELDKELSAIYGQWMQLVAAQQWTVFHRAVAGVLIILAIALVALFFSTWMNSLVNRLSMDRRQIQSLHTVTRVSLQFLALLLILLVIFGPPGQLGTFLGLAGAGLTVALKDFIVGFIGWFVLMGKNGIRMGDWVEINGVTGEVVEIGPFHTVLLETGNWTDSGHPTGRRVTFTNSFAIEGHYFNFSTTGQWLWDELTVVLPTGKDPYPIVEAIRKKVEEETRESGQQAEQEWRRAAGSRDMSGFSAVPSLSVKPVLGGVEVAVRYIAKANERFALRSKLNREAVQLLGGKEESWPAQK